MNTLNSAIAFAEMAYGQLSLREAVELFTDFLDLNLDELVRTI